jgi:hypothetical protein
MSVSIDQLVEASGLSPLFARSALQRAIDRCGVKLERLTPADAERLTQELRRVVAIFDPEGLEVATRRIRQTLGIR